jgi:hypothetical protein
MAAVGIPMIHSEVLVLRPFRKGDEGTLVGNVNNVKIASDIS